MTQLVAALSAQELLGEIAVMLFQRERLSLGQAIRLSATGFREFQHLLASRQIPIHSDVADFEEDLETLRELGRR